MPLIRPCCSKYFVMYVGGHVWALDWCPRIHEMPDYHIKCEVLVYFFLLFLVCVCANVTLLEFFWGICVSFTFNWYLSKKTSLLWCLDSLSFFFWVSKNYFIKEKISNPKILLRNLMLELGIHHHQGSLAYESLRDSLMCIL